MHTSSDVCQCTRRHEQGSIHNCHSLMIIPTILRISKEYLLLRLGRLYEVIEVITDLLKECVVALISCRAWRGRGWRVEYLFDNFQMKVLSIMDNYGTRHCTWLDTHFAECVILCVCRPHVLVIFIWEHCWQRDPVLFLFYDESLIAYLLFSHNLRISRFCSWSKF